MANPTQVQGTGPTGVPTEPAGGGSQASPAGPTGQEVRPELVNKLREAVTKLKEYDERFAKWVDTFDVVYHVLTEQSVEVKLTVYVYHNVEVKKIVLPAIEINTWHLMEVNRYMRLDEFNYETLKRVITMKLDDIIASFIHDLKEYAENIGNKIEETLEEVEEESDEE